MELIVRREQFDSLATIGSLFLDGVLECFTLEDRVRPAGEKVPGSTAIPEGRYRLVIDRSERFSRKASKKAGHPVDVFLPHLLDVPDFSGIRMHAGDTAEDTEGCILVGKDRHADWIGRSREALEALLPKITEALEQGEVWCRVEALAVDPTSTASDSGAQIGTTGGNADAQPVS